jgi:hypothetical protein
MSDKNIFDLVLSLPDAQLTAKEKTLLGFNERYTIVRDRIRLLLSANQISAWNKRFHGNKLQLSVLVQELYPLIIFFGDVGTGKTETAECIANRLVTDAGVEDSMLFKLSNRVRGKGLVGEMSTFIAEAFQKLITTAGKNRRAILIIDEGDSLGAARSQEHSHHEDKVAVNTLIQAIDDLRRQGGRIVTFLCTNRLSALDPALQRRAAVVQEFTRPNEQERRSLLAMDLVGLELSTSKLEELVKLTGASGHGPTWTYSDFRTRWYPSAVARAFPDRALSFEDLVGTAKELIPSPVVKDS